MLNLAIAPLVKKARARTSDPIQLSVIGLLELLATDVSAGERKRACVYLQKAIPARTPTHRSLEAKARL